MSDSSFDKLFTSELGITHSLALDESGNPLIKSEQDVSSILDANKAMLTHNDGYDPSRTWRRAGSIPMILIMQWLNEGFDAFAPGSEVELARRLDCSDYAHLRTAPGRIGIKRKMI